MPLSDSMSCGKCTSKSEQATLSLLGYNPDTCASFIVNRPHAWPYAHGLIGRTGLCLQCDSLAPDLSFRPLIFLEG